MKILITGGSSGLGKIITERLSISHEVYFTYCNSEKNIPTASLQ
jgi:NAD(P)-dependent dehydrogenase (short-subunit alcohol dehydrogenase family)